MALLDSYGNPIKIESKKIEPGHFATAVKANDFVSLLNLLPDPDPVLRKKGIEIKALRELLVDSHLEANVTVRFSSVSGNEWEIVSQSDDKESLKAHDFIIDNFKILKIADAIEEMMEHVLYGFKPTELLYNSDGRYWHVTEIAGKPSEWFSFDIDRNLVLKTDYLSFEDLPPYKFLCPRYKPSYDNPFGQKILSKCFWPVTFKRSGWSWWTSFVEKYGGAFLFGTYPLSNEKMKEKLLQGLYDMISDAVAVIPEGSKVDIHEATGKASSSSVFEKYKEAADLEISKAVLGQTLTTQSSPHGNQATATIHNMVREDIIKADKRRIADSLNQMIKWLTLLNFGETAIPSLFQFKEEESIKTEKAERDTKIFYWGFKPTLEYVRREYGFNEDDLVESSIKDKIKTDDFQMQFRKRNIFQKIISWFTDKPHITKEDKQEVRNNRIINEFVNKKANEFQDAVDNIIDVLFDEIQKAKDYNEVFELIINKYPELNVNEVCKIMDNIQYCSRQVGAFEKAKKKTYQGK
ncbi:MAG: DUF935 family protein [Spirochaetes bacterium]|nr:DUF935 family protein [Spirochaetota bacterium]